MGGIGKDVRPRVSRTVVFVAGFAALALSAAAVDVAADAQAGVFPPCAKIRTEALPDAAACLRNWSAEGQDGESATARLLKVSDQRQEQQDSAGSRDALDCAAAQVGEEGGLRDRYEVIRRYGLLDYKHDEIALALGRFECALGLAEALGDRAAIAKQLKNAGSARRRLGDYETALELLLRSLDMMRADGDPATGAVLNNIADFYRDSRRPKQAEEYYRQALEAFRRSGDVVEAMHVYDSLAELASDRGDSKAAIALLETALNQLRERGNRRYRLLIYAGLARVALADGDVTRARRYCADGLALAEEDGLAVPWELHLQTARADRLSGHLAPAEAMLRKVVGDREHSDHTRAALLRELADVLTEQGDHAGAVEALREAYQVGMRDAGKQSDQRLLWLSERFRTVERERENARLKHESSQRLLLIWLTAASSLAALLLSLLYFQRRQQRVRLVEAARRARDEEMLAQYRREAAALSEDRKLLQALLDSRVEALCLLDAEGQVLAVNRAACALLGVESQASSGHALSDFIAAEDALAWREAMEKMEDAQSLQLSLSARESSARLHAELSLWEQDGGGMVAVGLYPASPGDTLASAPEPATERAPASGNAVREGFRQALVALMAATVKAWEYNTGLNRLELAERSRIWRINIDDGRLRARSMERYLSQVKLPRNPRWRDVLRTAYFVLEQPQMREAERADLQRHVDELLVFMRRRPQV